MGRAEGGAVAIKLRSSELYEKSNVVVVGCL